jgi:DeoR/GlpR family transcriptional regulator of sugar metabolism
VAVHLLGGQYFRRSSLLVGGHAVKALRGWRFDVAFLGAEGLTADGLWNSVAEVVTLQKAVIAASRRAVWCLDASKVGRGAHEFLLPLARVERVLTDAPASALATAGIRLPPRALVAA